jgi:hypothetical protein
MLIPVFYVVIQRASEKVTKKETKPVETNKASETN